MDNYLEVKNSCKRYPRIYETGCEMRVTALHLKPPRRAQYTRENFVLRIVTSMFSKRKCIEWKFLRHATSLF